MKADSLRAHAARKTIRRIRQNPLDPPNLLHVIHEQLHHSRLGISYEKPLFLRHASKLFGEDVRNLALTSLLHAGWSRHKKGMQWRALIHLRRGGPGVLLRYPVAACSCVAL